MDTPSPASLSVVIAGGGTGGHLYPGIAVAREILRRRPDAKVTFAGTAQGLESKIVPREGFELDVIRSAGLRGKSPSRLARGLSLLVPSLRDAWKVLSERRPHVVVGVGGYSSGPVVLTACVRRIPTLVMEQNAAPGLANRVLARFVRSAAVTYEETLRFFGDRGFVAGNPVRAEFLTASALDMASVRTRRPRVLILGGSQGAHAINVAIAAAAARIHHRHPEAEFVHQTGARDLEEVRRAYAQAGVPARVEAFLDPVAGEMAEATLVVSRAGATTLAELAAAGRPAVLVPLPTATDDHQRKNARVLANAGAAVIVEQALGADGLSAAVGGLLDEPESLVRMARAIKAFGRPEAARRIVDRVFELAE